MQEDITRIIEREFHFTCDRTSFSYARFSTHLQHLFERMSTNTEIATDNAHANGIPVHICGGSAADTLLIDFYCAVGIDELSVSPGSVLEVKKAVIKSKPVK